MKLNIYSFTFFFEFLFLDLELTVGIQCSEEVDSRLTRQSEISFSREILFSRHVRIPVENDDHAVSTEGNFIRKRKMHYKFSDFPIYLCDPEFLNIAGIVI